MQFEVLPISEDNADIDFLNLIERDGLTCFITLSEKIKDGTEEDKRFFKNYLNNYLFGGVNFTQNVWLELINSISTNKKTLELIEYIELNSNKRVFTSIIVRMYSDDDIDKVLLNPLILPFWDLKESGILDKLLKRKKLNLMRFLKCQGTREQTKEWINNFYNDNKRLKSLASVNIIDIYHLDKKFEDLTYVAMQLLKLFMRGITMEKLNEFKMPTEENTFLNELFYIVHKYLNLSIMNLIGIVKSIRDAVEEMEETYRTSMAEGNLVTANMYKLKVDFFSKLIDKLDKINYDKNYV